MANKELLPRQQELYNLIYHNSFIEHRKTTQEEICEKLKDFGYEYSENENSHDRCTMIWADIKDNNESDRHDHIIIYKDFQAWIGSESETKAYIQSLWKALSPRLSRFWKYYKKIQKDKTYRLFDENGNPNNAKKFYDCFNDFNVEMLKEENETNTDSLATE